jgi:Predicted protease
VTALAAALPAAASAAPAAGWVATSTQATKLAGAQLLGATPASTPVRVDVALRSSNPSAESAALKAMYTPGSATYQQFLTPAQFAAEYAPSSASVQAVQRYLSGQGFTDITLIDGMLVTADGTAASAEKAFDTSLANFALPSGTVYANSTAAMVPAALGNTVQAVLGLNNVPMPTPHPVAHTAGGTPPPGLQAAGSPSPFESLPPKDFQNTYDATGTPSGSGTAIALFTEGDLSQVYKDLRTAEAAYHLPQVAVTQIDVGPQSSDTSGLDEWDLDTQSSTAMATTVKHLYLYDVGSLTDASIVPSFATFVAQDKATAMSASIGGCDVGPFLDGSLVTTDEILEQGAMQGQTLFASSGDNGAGCMYGAAVGVPTPPPGTNWPASGEFTTAVGGTSLLADASGNRVEEIGWVGSGGGISEVENPGWWTQDSDPGYNNQYVSGGRAVPDVALDADPNFFTAANIYVNGSAEGIGGTSLSSPLMLGTWARIESAHGNKEGLASIDFYRLYDKLNPGTPEDGGTVVVPTPPSSVQPVPGFTDITLGDNGPYAATPGYDLITGLGAPDIAALSKALGQH